MWRYSSRGDMCKGYKVVSLSAPVNGAKSKYKDVSVWAATQLKTAAGVNVTDVSYDASITNGNVTDIPPIPTPYAFIARSIGCDPYYGTQTYSSILPVVDDIKAVNNQITPWEIKVSYSWESDSLLVANADVCSYTAQKGDFKIAYILVADSLQGKSGSWIQKPLKNYSFSVASRSSVLNHNRSSVLIYERGCIKILMRPLFSLYLNNFNPFFALYL